MKLLIALDAHFYRTPDGRVWADTIYDYVFWGRYLEVFGEVLVVARVRDVPDRSESWNQSSGASVRFHGVPDFIGPRQMVFRYSSIVREISLAARQCDRAVLRVPSIIGALAWKALRKRTIPTAIEVVGDPWESLAPGTVKSAVRPIVRWWSRKQLTHQCRHADAVLYVTERTLQQRYPHGSHAYAIGCSDVELDESAYQAGAIRGTQNGTVQLVNVGSMTTLYKAQHHLMEAVRICLLRGHIVHLHLVGDGQYRGYFERMANDLNISEEVTFHGLLSGASKVRAVLDEADVFLMPSLTEGLPRAMLEAMARGLPCLGTRVGGIVELLEPEETVEPGSVQALADKIIETILNRAQRTEMSARNYAKAQHYGKSILHERRTRFYRFLKEAQTERGRR